MTSTYPGKNGRLFFQKQSFPCVLQNGFLKNFANFTKETPVLESLANKVALLKPFKFIKKRLQHMCFPVKNANFLKKSFLQNTWWLLLFFELLLLKYKKKVSFCLKVIFSVMFSGCPFFCK